MYSERLQILVSKEQRRRLEREAKRRGASVASLIRDAIDSQLGSVGREERLGAVQKIAAMRGAPYLAPDELRDAIEEARVADAEHGLPARGDS